MPPPSRRRPDLSGVVIPNKGSVLLDQAGPFATGLSSLVVPAWHVGSDVYEDLAAPGKAAGGYSSVGTQAYTTGTPGVGLKFDTTNALRKTGTVPWGPTATATFPVTIAVYARTLVQPTAANYSAIAGLYRNNAGAQAAPYAFILLNGEVGQNEITLDMYTGTTETYLSGIAWPAINEPFICIVTTRAINDHTIVLRNLATGVITTLTHAVSVGLAAASPDEDLIGGSAPAGTINSSSSYNGEVYARWIWNRGMTAAEAHGFVLNPFGMLAPRRRIRAAATVSADVTVNLTGVAGTGAVGTVVPTVAKTPTGVAGTGAVGTAVPTVAPTVTGVAGTGQVGTAVPTVAPTVTGVAGTGAVGTAVPTVIPTVTGVAGTGAVGTVAVQLDTTATLTGVAGTGAVGTVTPTVAPTVTGVAGTGAVGTVVPTVIPTVTGVAGTGAAGTVTVTTTGDQVVNLTGVAGTGAVGTAVPTVAPTVTGVAGTGQVGTVVPGVAPTITGVAGTGTVGDVTVTTTGDKIVNIASVEGIGAVGTLTVQADTPVVAGPGEFAWNASRFKRKKKPKRDQDDENEPPKPPGPPDHIPEEAAAITYDTSIPEYERAIAGVETAAREGLEKKRRLLLRERVRAARKAAEQDEEDSILLLLG